jgi:hypothetical protein
MVSSNQPLFLIATDSQQDVNDPPVCADLIVNRWMNKPDAVTSLGLSRLNS